MGARRVSPSSTARDVTQAQELWAPPPSVKWRPTLWTHKVFEVLNPIRPSPLRRQLSSRKCAHVPGNPQNPRLHSAARPLFIQGASTSRLLLHLTRSDWELSGTNTTALQQNAESQAPFKIKQQTVSSSEASAWSLCSQVLFCFFSHKCFWVTRRLNDNLPLNQSWIWLDHIRVKCDPPCQNQVCRHTLKTRDRAGYLFKCRCSSHPNFVFSLFLRGRILITRAITWLVL